MSHDRNTRRQFITGALGALTAARWLEACGGNREDAQGATSTDGADASAANDGGVAADAASCTVYPRQTDGPFYLDLALLRRDITEGKPGSPLEVVIQVIDASTCAPLAGLAVDLWQCDASGVYSGYPGQLGGLDTTGEKFLRGTQVTDGDGRVTFDTLYPGWYPGRTTHTHFKIHLSATLEATSQMYFPEDVTANIYSVAPYASHGAKDTTNVADSVNKGHVPPLVTISAGPGGGNQATLVVGVAS